jgi:hypothetical protein
MKANIKYFILLSLIMPCYVLAADRIIGINELNFKKLPLGLVDFGLPDSDRDGLDDDLEKAIGTNPLLRDTDKDGYDDKTEIANDYSPTGPNKTRIDKNLAEKLSGAYLLRVEKGGQLWHVSSRDAKVYYAGNAARKKILLEKLYPATSTSPATADNSLSDLAAKIRNNDKAGVLAMFANDYQKRIGYTMDNLSSEQKLLWANTLSSAKLASQTENEKVFLAEVYFSLKENKVKVEYRMTKQTNGSWLVSSL